jgi:hypothetical protein
MVALDLERGLRELWASDLRPITEERVAEAVAEPDSLTDYQWTSDASLSSHLDPDGPRCSLCQTRLIIETLAWIGPIFGRMTLATSNWVHP